MKIFTNILKNEIVKFWSKKVLELLGMVYTVLALGVLSIMMY